MNSKALKICALTLGLIFACVFTSQAQRHSGQVGLGFQVGSPTGLSIQFYRERGASLDLLFAYDWDHFFFFNMHGLWDHHLDEQQHFHVFYGPGAFIGFYDKNGRNELHDDDPVIGLSGDVGLNLVLGRVELFGQVTPRVAVVPATDVDFGGGVGMRFYVGK